MSTPTNHWKLGLFVVVGIVLGLAAAVFLGARSLNKQVVSYVTFFDESVQGLEVGAPVKFRGVTLGSVSHIDIADDHRHVEVTSDLTITDLRELGLAHGKGRNATLDVPAELRMQLASQGITGVKFLQLDFFDPKDNPPPVLPFPTPPRYIPAAVSTMKNLEDAVVHAVDRFPEVADAVLRIMAKVEIILDGFDAQKLPARLGGTLAQADRVMASLQKAVHDLDAPQLSKQTSETLATLDATIHRLEALLDHVDGKKGLLASVQRTSNALGDIATDARGVGPELEETLRDIQELTGALERVSAAVDRDPDMLLKGRGKVK